MTTEPCVPEPELQRFLLGDLDEQRFAAVAAHVDNCNPCQDTVVAMADQSDTFVSAMKSAGADTPEGSENALRQGLERVFTSLGTKPTEPQSTTLPDDQRQIGLYRVEEQLGAGGMGHVYRAKHTKLKRDVALKVLSTNRWVNAAAVTRFEREMEAIGQLDHPHIVRASDAGEANGMHYLAMEYVDGLDLARLVNRLGSIAVADACELARQCAIGLHYAHENGLVHRDIKPSNLMLARDKSAERGGNGAPIVKILDLGLALLGDEHLQAGHDITTVGTLMGTLNYMSPEQGIDSHGVDRRTDVYSLGATLFKLLTGRVPYADPQYGTLMRKMTALATKDAPSIGSVRTDLPAELVDVIDRMLSRDPDERYATAGDVAEALEPFVTRADLTNLLRSGVATEDPIGNATPRIPVVGLLDDGPAVSPQKEVPARSGRKRNRWLVAIVAAFTVLAASVLFRMATDFGELVITSDDPDATVLVKRVGKAAKELKIKNGKGGLRLWTGEYELEVKGDASVQINPTSVDIARSTTSSATIDSTSSSVIGSTSEPKLKEPIDSSPAVVTQGRQTTHTQAQDSLALQLDGLPEKELKLIMQNRIPKLKGPIEISVSREQNTIVLKGPEDQIAKLREYIKELLQDKVIGDHEVASFLLFNSEPKDLSVKIQKIYNENFVRIHGPARISFDTRASCILVFGSKGASDLVGQLVRSLDGKEVKPGGDGGTPHREGGGGGREESSAGDGTRSAEDYDDRSAEIKDLMSQIKASRAEYYNAQPRISSLQKTCRSADEINEKIEKVDVETAELSNGLVSGNEPAPRFEEYTVNVPYQEIVDGRNIIKMREETGRRELPGQKPRINSRKKQKLVSLGLDRKMYEKELAKLLDDRGLSSIEEMNEKLKQRKDKRQAAREKLNAAKLAFNEKLDVLRKDRLKDPAYRKQIIRPHSRLKIKANVFVPFSSMHSIDDVFGLESSGAVHLGPEIGRVTVVGMTYEEAEQTISNELYKKFARLKLDGRSAALWSRILLTRQPVFARLARQFRSR